MEPFNTEQDYFCSQLQQQAVQQNKAKQQNKQNNNTRKQHQGNILWVG